MKQKPRGREDHLVTRKMFNRAYFQIGMIQASAGFMSYFMVMADHGFFITDLFNLRSAWDDKQHLIYNRYGEFYVSPRQFAHLNEYESVHLPNKQFSFVGLFEAQATRRHGPDCVLWWHCGLPGKMFFYENHLITFVLLSACIFHSP